MVNGTFIFLLLAAAETLAHAQINLSSNSSIADPTELDVAASQANATLLWSQDVGEIQSTTANAVVTAIEVVSQDGRPRRGVMISLRGADSTDKLSLGERELQRFRDELAELESVSTLSELDCEATVHCVNGIARCRPSQTELQAYCPTIYTTPNSEEGFGLSTPRNSFLFPSIKPSNFAVAINSAVAALETRSRATATESGNTQ